MNANGKPNLDGQLEGALTTSYSQPTKGVIACKADPTSSATAKDCSPITTAMTSNTGPR